MSILPDFPTRNMTGLSFRPQISSPY